MSDSNDFTPTDEDIKVDWLHARHVGGGVSLDDADDEYERWLAQHDANVVGQVAERIRKSFDHYYDDTEDAIGSVDYAEGYRHRDRQVRQILEGF